MKAFVLGFARRGLNVCILGPFALAVLYLVLDHQGILEPLSARQVSTGICSLTVLAFIAGGINAIYQLERLPLMLAILIHGGVLYIGYLLTYLVNGWLEWGTAPVLVFSIIFVVGYLLIWAAIYLIIRRRTASLNRILREKQQSEA